MKIEELYREVILEYADNKDNIGLVNDEHYKNFHLLNRSCGDEVNMQVLVKDDKVVDIRHESTGCSICRAAASFAAELFKNKSLEESKNIFLEYYELVKGTKVSGEHVGNIGLAFGGVSSFPARVRCATLGFKALEEAIKEASCNE